MQLQYGQHLSIVENLVYEWARAIDEDRVEAIADLMADIGRYRVRSRFNADRGLPAALIDIASAAQMRDRIKSMRLANVYEPQHYRHLVTGVQVIGEEEGALAVRSNFAVVRTMDLTGNMQVYATGQARDLVATEAGDARFVSRDLVLDSRVVETLLVIPL